MTKFAEEQAGEFNKTKFGYLDTVAKNAPRVRMFEANKTGARATQTICFRLLTAARAIKRPWSV